MRVQEEKLLIAGQSFQWTPQELGGTVSLYMKDGQYDVLKSTERMFARVRHSSGRSWTVEISARNDFADSDIVDVEKGVLASRTIRPLPDSPLHEVYSITGTVALGNALDDYTALDDTDRYQHRAIRFGWTGRSGFLGEMRIYDAYGDFRTQPRYIKVISDNPFRVQIALDGKFEPAGGVTDVTLEKVDKVKYVKEMGPCLTSEGTQCSTTAEKDNPDKGLREITVTCMKAQRDGWNPALDPGACGGLTEPPKKEVCDLEPCVRYVESKWSECDLNNCVRRRNVQCFRGIEQVSDRVCGGPKPLIEEACLEPCWKAGDWGECEGQTDFLVGTQDTKCHLRGNEMKRTREVTCRRGETQVPEHLCLGTKPKSQEVCNANAPYCYEYLAGPWGPCSGPGSQGECISMKDGDPTYPTSKRNLLCVRDKLPVPLGVCEGFGLRKPATEKICRGELPHCTEFRAGEWSDCYPSPCTNASGKNPGEESFRTREVRCYDGSIGRYVDDGVCEELKDTKPVPDKPCPTIPECERYHEHLGWCRPHDDPDSDDDIPFIYAGGTLISNERECRNACDKYDWCLAYGWKETPNKSERCRLHGSDRSLLEQIAYKGWAENFKSVSGIGAGIPGAGNGSGKTYCYIKKSTCVDEEKCMPPGANRNRGQTTLQPRQRHGTS